MPPGLAPSYIIDTEKLIFNQKWVWKASKDEHIITWFIMFIELDTAPATTILDSRGLPLRCPRDPSANRPKLLETWDTVLEMLENGKIG